MVVGCGALGNEVLKDLVLTGVRHLVIVDFDTVEADNLSRSVLFSREDAAAGRRKVEAAAERLKQMSPDLDIQQIFGDIAYDVGLGLIRRMDVVIGCVDNRWARYCINRLCMRAGIPWVDGGIEGLEGTARVFKPGENCYACNLGPEGLKDMAYRMPCSGVIRRDLAAGKSPTTPIAAAIIAAVEAQEALKIVESSKREVNGRSGKEWQGVARSARQYKKESREFTSLCGKMFYYEGEHLTTRIVDFKAWDDDCPVHERWEPVEPSPLRVQNTVAETLDYLNTKFSTVRANDYLPLQIVLEDCFVDYVAKRTDDRRYEVMKPGRAVAAFVESHRLLRGIPFSNLYQHEWQEIGNDFPYQHLTLADLGIPSQAVLRIKEKKEHYIEIKN